MKRLAPTFLLIALSALALPRLAPSAPTPIKPVTASLHAPSFNPHLHGAIHIAATPKPLKPTLHPAAAEPAIIHHPWQNRWDAAQWRTAHLQYGDITGLVFDATGHPVPNAHVWLQHPTGKPFSTRPPKHATNTNAQGRFTMKHVLAADYKLNTFGRGPWAKTGDHTQVQVHPGGTLHIHFTLK